MIEPPGPGQIRREWWLPTPDDWAPTRDDGLVRISLIIDPEPSLLNRVQVMGGDDFGLERDYEDPEDAHWMFDEISSWGIVTQEGLRDYGFWNA